MFDLEDDEPVEVQMAPLIDCVFLLLIFFLVTSTLRKTELEIPLELPAAAQTVPVAAEPEVLVISIDAAGQVYVDQLPVTTDQLLQRLDAVEEMAEAAPRIRLDADRLASYGDVIRVIDELRARGITTVGLQTAGDDLATQAEQADE